MTAPIVPPVPYQTPKPTRYCMTKNEGPGSAPLRYEWDRLELFAASIVQPSAKVAMTPDIESLFIAMQRHKWTRASGPKIELEIIA